MQSMTVHVSEKFKMVAVPYNTAAANLFPEAKPLTIGNAPHLAIHHGISETFLLRKLGFDVPSPIGTHYDWCGGTPFDVQKKTCAMLTMNARAFVLNGMGTGKTKSALWAWDFLTRHGKAKKALVLAPLSTLNFTWAREVFSTVPHKTCSVLHHPNKAKRLERLKQDADIYVINHDGLKVILPEVMALVKAGEIDTLIIDELAVYRNGGSQRTKITRELARHMTWVWGMTGSPIPNEPTDAWSQVSIVKPDNVPKYFGRFRDELMHKLTQFKWVPKADAVDKAFAVMQPAVRFTLDDVVELPDLVTRMVDIDMGPKQEAVYKALLNHCYAAVQNKEITAANAGAVMMKLLQVATGWVYSADRGVVTLDNTERVDALMDMIEAADHKVLVFVPFKHALAGIGERLTKEGVEHAIVSGDTSGTERSQIFNLFQNTGKYRVLLAHPQCLAHGITLTSASTIVWFAPVTSLEIYDQANHRIRRIGQKNKQQIIHLQATPVEKRIYALLQRKQKVQDQLLELFEEASRTVSA
jgi:SNF2 family DNA or RNA helicase